MKVALTVWEGRISPVFDVSREALVLTVHSGAVTARTLVTLHAGSPGRKVDRLAELGVDTLICGAMTRAPCEALAARGVTVLGFVAGDVDEVVAAFLAGRLPCPALSMPGCGGRRRRRRGAGGGARRCSGRRDAR